MDDTKGIGRRHVLAGMAVAAGTPPSALAASFNQPQSTTTGGASGSAVSATGWNKHLEAFSRERDRWLNSPWAETEDEKARATFQVLTTSHVGFNAYVSPLLAYPIWSKVFPQHPLLYQWGLNNPDFMYQFTWLDGARTYRIWGSRGTRRWTTLHAQAGFWGDEKPYLLGAYDLDDFEIAPDGSFEIIASPEPHDGNWIKLDANARFVQMFLRNVAYDWTHDQSVQLHIEALDRTDADNVWVGLGSIDERLEKVARFMKHSTDYWLARNEELMTQVGYNAYWRVPDRTEDASNTACKYLMMLYNIKPDEALVIETELPGKVDYWGVELADLCYATLDFAYHQSCLNGHQAVVDPDGKVRLVVSLSDPGVANWLDPAGVPRGNSTWRWVNADVVPLPTVTKVPLKDVAKHLPAGTKRVTPEEREASLAQRRKDVWRLYGL